MLKFILQYWRNQRSKLLLLLIGALIIASGLNLIFKLNETNRGVVEETLQKRWSSAYDIVVRPTTSSVTTEAFDLLEPNYLNGIVGGISFEQYEKIKEMENVDVAAPVAIVGYTQLNVTLPNMLQIPDQGLFRLTHRQFDETGLEREMIAEEVIHIAKGTTEVLPRGIGLLPFDQVGSSVTPGSLNLIVAVDPDEEAKLVGLDQAVTSSSYFSSDDRAVSLSSDQKHVRMPILVNPASFNDGYHEYELEQLDVPFSSSDDQKKVLQDIASESDLLRYDVETVQTLSIPSKDLEAIYFNQLQGKKTPDYQGALINEGSQLVFQSGSLEMKETDSPFPERWVNAFELESQPVSFTNKWLPPSMLPEQGFRPVNSTEIETTLPESDEVIYLSPVLDFAVVGTFDPEKIAVSKDPLNELPMETYRPASADLVLDQDASPLNPSVSINTSGNPAGLLTNSPSIITTLDAARLLNGEQAISSIRIKVDNIDTLNESSETLLQELKQQIERDTGLIATITTGSSPQPVITKVVKEGNTLGWIEQPWIHLGVAITIFRETSAGYSGVVLSIIGVAIIYVLTTSYIAMLSRRREFAILLALGWSQRDLYKIIYIEALILAALVSIVSLAIESVFFFIQGAGFSFWSWSLITAFSLLIYLSGATWSAFNIQKIKPYEVIRVGEYANAASSIIPLKTIGSFALKEMVSKWRRNLLSVASIAVPTSLLVFFVYVTFHLQGVLYTSWLGQFVAVQIGTLHYVTIGVSALIAVLTTGEIIWQNVLEREHSFALLKAIGWTDRSIRQLVMIEGLIVGFVAGVLGLGLAYLAIYFAFGLIPWASALLTLLSLLLPSIVGGIASLIPASMASKVNPYETLKRIG
ncbi:ABC transporter permease [Exiguobacterium alkaliphilum]|uniref:ABC transporter permease n=1 Tax=Exiguobacterium alkaliphilum TaxID=1428684 RepID=UPI00403A8CB6